jgi:hypothetical protein
MSVLQYRATMIARDMTPQKSMNLALNALKDIPLGGEDFMLRWHGFIAPYVEYLENPTFRPHIHDNFIKRDIKNTITGLVNSMKNGTFHEDSFAKIESRVDSMQPTHATNVQMLQSIGGVSLV